MDEKKSAGTPPSWAAKTSDAARINEAESHTLVFGPASSGPEPLSDMIRRIVREEIAATGIGPK